jgi:hypothetical protein
MQIPKESSFLRRLRCAWYALRLSRRGHREQRQNAE